MSFNEIKQHGRADFPFELYKVNAAHPKYEMAFHWHSAFELIRVLKGRLDLTLDNRSYSAVAGDVLFVNSEVIHGATPHDCEYECLVFHPEILKTGCDEGDRFIDGLLTHVRFIHERLECERVKMLAEQLCRALDEQKSGYVFKVLGLSAELFGEIWERKLFSELTSTESERDSRKICKLKRVLKFIRDNFAGEITLENMAKEVGFSTKYFCDFFKASTGTTPMKYLLDYRIERAARKLGSTDASVTDVAYDCGFNDLSYFIKTFKERKGVTPRQYRKIR